MKFIFGRIPYIFIESTYSLNSIVNYSIFQIFITYNIISK
nr:MAG TPA: hypothetical protein [Caudoviricetes sp.]